MRLDPGTMKNKFTFLALLFVSAIASIAHGQQDVNKYEGVARVKILNYEDCVVLSNPTTRVVLGHHVGGRVLVYERQGKNVLYLSPKESEWVPGNRAKSPMASAGRFDIGPEFFQTRGNALWNGEWTVSVIGDRRARMTSSIDPKSGLRVYRQFELDAESSRLTFKQTVENRSAEIVRQCFWSRTFANHGGVAVVPCDPRTSRFPNLYTMSRSRYLIDVGPTDPAVRRVDNLLVIDRPTKFPKLGFDSVRGWVAYQTREDQLFVKKYRVFPDETYGEATGINLSIWYPQKDKLAACEIEPIGPLVALKPGDESSFTVDWWLLDRKFPESGVVDPIAVAKVVEANCVIANKEK